MVADNIDSHFLHQAVKSHGGGPLESGIRIPSTAHTVNDLRAFVILFHKLVQHLDIILQVRI